MSSLKVAVYGLVVLLVAVLIGRCGYGCGQRSRSGQIDALTQALAESERTVKVKDGLYQTTLVEVSDAKRLIESHQSENRDLLVQLEAAKSRVLTTERIVVKWLPRESKVDVDQTEVPPDPGGVERVVRKRVDFRHDFGPFLVSGYTLTDPADGFVTIAQGRPLALTLAVSRDRQGRWLHHVSSSDPEVTVEVSLGAVDPGVLRPRWHQRLWLIGATNFVGGMSVGLGLEYRGDKFSLGSNCHIWSEGRSCGASFGVRIFK